MDDSDYDAVIAGAGPAGSLTALLLARRGHRVLLAERSAWPRYKVCGCCLNRRALGVLERAGLLADVRAMHGCALRAFEVRARGASVRLPLPGGIAVSRRALDDLIVQRAKSAGAAFASETSAAFSGAVGHRRIVSLTAPSGVRAVTARFVVGAAGLGGGPLRGESWYRCEPAAGARIGGGALVPAMPQGYEPGVIYMACGAEGYVGMTAVEGGAFDVAAAFDADFVKRSGGLSVAAERILDEAGHPAVPAFAAVKWRGTPELTRRAPCVAHHGAFAVGDATGYVEPFTGEGMAWALASAEALADLLDEALRDGFRDPEREWARRHRRIVRRRQWLCRGLAAGLRRPRLAAAAVSALSWAPGLAAPFVSHLNAGDIHT